MGSAASSSPSSSSTAVATATPWSVGVSIASPVASPRAAAKRESDYFYTLVFANTRASDADADASIAGSHDRVAYADALATLRAVTSGGRERETRVVDEFRAAWVAKFRTPAPAPHDAIPWRYFQELMRELVVQRFDAISDLFLKTALSDDGRALVLSFRPSRALLCVTADRLRLRVAMMAEIDPGERYWCADPTRAVAESYQWSRADAQEELYRLFLAGKISTQEAQLFDDVDDREDAGMWSRRLHALRRFCDSDVATIVTEQERAAAATSTTPTTTFLPFQHRASLRYLYRQIDGAGDDATPFRVVDKIRLTKAIIDSEFDCDALVAKGLLAHHCCLHTHHTDAVDTSIDVLRVQWGAVSSPWRLYRQRLTTLARLLHFQPLAHVRNYFGEEVALYFAYTSFYARALQWLCVAAVAAAALHALPVVNGLASEWYYVAFALVNTAFTQAFVRKWAIHERVYATQWGVAERRDAPDVARPQFRGQLAVSPITHRLETHYSPHRRQLQQLASAVLLLSISAGLLVVDYAVLTWDVYATASATFPVLVHVAIAVVAKLLVGPWAALCKALTEWENYRSQQDYDVNLTLKFATVQTVNLFGMLWLQTFVLPLLARHDAQTLTSTPTQAAHLLLTFLGVDLALSLWDLRDSFLQAVTAWLPSSRQRPFDNHGSCRDDPVASGDRARLLTPPPSSTASTIADELALEPYEGVMFDYAQVIITFGFVTWFAALAPLATLLAWAVAVLQIRVDAFKLCVLRQRPFPTQKHSIGSWGAYLRVLAFGSWFHNALLTVLYLASAATPSGVADLRDFLLLHEAAADDNAERARLVTETHVLVVFAGFGVVAWLASLYDASDRAQLKQLRWRRVRQRFLENKYINNLDRVPDAVRAGLPSGRVFLNGVHRYVVTGNKAEEDAAEELLDELVQLQRESLQLQRQIVEMRATDAPVGTLVVEVGSINILPVMDALTKAVDSFLQLQLTYSNDDDDGSSRGTDDGNHAPFQKKAKPVNTSVVKKQRSPAWTESFELALQSLDDALLVRVFDWELLGKNRRIGHATLCVADVVATVPPLALPAPATATATSATADTLTALPLLHTAAKVRMASFEVAIEMPDVLLSTMHADLVRHGHPKLALRCGVQLDALGRLLLHQRDLRSEIRQLQAHEKQFFEWT